MDTSILLNPTMQLHVEAMQAVEVAPFSSDTPVEFTLAGWTEVSDAILSQLLPLDYFVFSPDLWKELIGSEGFFHALEPVSQFALITTGQVATLRGAKLLTDAYFDLEERPLTGKRMLAAVSMPRAGRGFTIHKVRLA